MADHVGVYAISGAFMPNPATVAAKTTTPTGVLVTRTFTTDFNAAGSTVVNLNIPTNQALVSLGNEVVALNAMQSGTLVIESGAAGVIGVPTYYSKATRLNHQIYRRTVDLTDVLRNIPDISPSSSVSGGVHVFMKQIGSLVSPYSFLNGASDIGPFHLSMSNPADANALLAALSGNIMLFVSGAHSFYMAVTGASLQVNNELLIYPTASLERLGDPSWTSGTFYLHSWVPLSSSVSGVYINTTFYDPIQISIPVTSSGRIRDLRVWTEFVHDYRTGSQSQASSSVLNGAWGLQSLQIALRSPNTNFRAAHPVWNAPGAELLLIRTQVSLTGTDNKFGNTYLGVPELLRNSYLLWAGHTVDEGPTDLLGNTLSMYHEFDLDIDMRTVFWDGSTNRNPRDILYLHPSAGVTRSYADMAQAAISGVDYPSPSAFMYSYSTGTVAAPITLSGTITGSDVPWMVDNRLDAGNLLPTGSFYTRATGTVPPDGWLTTLDVSVKGWQNAFIPTGYPRMFRAGRIIVRTQTNQVYIMGGEDPGGTGSPSCSNYVAMVPFTVDRLVEQISLGQPTVLQNSSMPASLSKMGIAYYTSSVGEHIILVGGKSSTFDTVGVSGVFFGDFNVNDINWQTPASATQNFPRQFYGGFTYVVANRAYVIGGFTSGTKNSNVYSIEIDGRTGRPPLTATWEIVGPSSSVSTNYPSAQVNSAFPLYDHFGNLYFIISYSGSWEVAQIAAHTVPLSIATTINDVNSSPIPHWSSASDAPYRFPLVGAGGHVFAPFASGAAHHTTYAIEIDPAFQIDFSGNVSYLAGFQITSSWHHNEQPAPVDSSVAVSGCSAVYGNVLFLAGASPTGSNEAQLLASTVIIQAPNVGEFGTRGQQIGPQSIRPVYPILDDVYGLKSFDAQPSLVGQNHGDIRGFRPGLRGTECSGTWSVLFGMAAQAFDPVSGSIVEPSVGVWLRQIRLELVTDQGYGVNSFYPSRERRYTRSSLVPGQDGFQTVGVVSGAGAWDIGLNQTQILQSPEYGRSVGITAATASSPASFAVQTYITGALFDHLSGTGVTSASNPSWFLGGNGFGTPYIPDSLMAILVTGTAEDIDASASQALYKQTVGQTTLVPNANTMTDYLRRVNYSQTTQRVAEVSATPPSASYFGF